MATNKHNRPRMIWQRLKSNVAFGAGIAVCCLAMLIGQVWGLRALMALDGERQKWTATEEGRRAQLDKLEKETETVQSAITDKSKRLGEIKAEIAKAQTDRDRVVGELAESQKQLELARTAATDAEKAQQLASQQSQQALDAKLAAESRIVELASQNTKLKSDISRLQEEQGQLTKSVDEGRTSLAKLNTELATVRKQITDGQKQVDSIQGKLRELQASVVKESQSLDAAVTDNGKTLRKREEMLGEVATAEQRLPAIKKQEETLKTGNAELQKTNLQLAAEKTDSVKSAGEVQTRLNDLQKQFSAKTTELEAILKRIEQANAEEKRLLEVIKGLSEKVPPKEKESSEGKTENKADSASPTSEEKSSK